MKIFIGQRVTGEDIEKLREENVKLVEALEKLNHKVYCTFLEGRKWEDEVSSGGKLKFAFKKIDENDVFLAIVRNEHKSEGMLMEIGHVLSSGKKLIVAVNKKVKDKTYLDELADQVIEFENFEDLLNKLGEIK